MTAEDEQALLDWGGQELLDQYRQAYADAKKSVIDYLVEVGSEVLLEVIGVNDAKRCFGDADVAACLWTVINVGSLLLLLAKLPQVSAAVAKAVGGLTKFLEASSAGRALLDKSRDLAAVFRNACVPSLKLASDASVRASAACKIKHVSPVDQDWATKGAHINLENGREVRIYPDGNGGISGEGIRVQAGVASQKEVDAVVAAIKVNPKLRQDLIDKTRSAMEKMNAGEWGMDSNRAAEMMFLIKALEKI